MARKMKNSGIEWIGEIPFDWEITTIKRIFTLFAGATPKSEIPENWDGDIVWITPADYKTIDKYVSQGKRNISEMGLSSCSATLIPCNSIIFSKRAPIGSVVINSVPLCTNQGCISNVPKNGANAIFYYYVMSIYTEQFELYSAGTTFKEISANNFGNFKIVFPPFYEQQRIANYLDKKCAEIDSLSSDIQSQISILEDYKKAVITEAVTKGLNPDVEMKDSGIEWIEKLPITWCKARIGYNSWIRARLGWKGLKAEEYVDKGYAFLSAFNIINNQLNWNDLNYINQERYDESPEIKLCIGDIILVKDGAGIGKCARIDALPVGEATTNGSLAVISTYNSLNYQYLYYYLQSSMFQNYILRIMNGMGVPHLSQEHLRKIIIPIPPIREQQEISDYLDYRCIRIDDAINEKREQLEVLEQYKKSLIYEYVTGKKEVIIND